MAPGRIDDETPLNGGTIDVGARCGWLLRTARVLHGGVARLEDMAAAAGVSTTRVHRLETGVRRDGRLIDCYEDVLGVARGSLRAPVDIMCRTFPESPRDVDPGPRLVTDVEVSGATETLVAALASERHPWAGPPPEQPVTGGAWLDWARAISGASTVGMPLPVLHDLVTRLISELARSVGPAYPSRYEALSLIRCSPVGHVVVEAARREVDDPHVQVVNDLMSAVGEAVTPAATAWVVTLLEDPRDHVMSGACLAVENMAQILGDATRLWARIVDPVTTAFNDAEPGSDRHARLSHLLRLAPRDARSGAAVRPSQALAADAEVDSWSRSRLNAHWTDCERRARDVAHRVGLRDQPMLTRLLFDIAMGPLETRAVTSYMLLGALPDLSRHTAEHLADLAEHHADPVIRERSLRRLPGTLHGHPAPDAVRRWLGADDPGLRSAAVHLLASAGEQPAREDVACGLAAGGPYARRLLYATGVTGHPVLGELVDDPEVPPDVRGGAAWWLRQGERVPQ